MLGWMTLTPACAAASACTKLRRACCLQPWWYLMLEVIKQVKENAHVSTIDTPQPKDTAVSTYSICSPGYQQRGEFPVGLKAGLYRNPVCIALSQHNPAHL